MKRFGSLFWGIISLFILIWMVIGIVFVLTATPAVLNHTDTILQMQSQSTANSDTNVVGKWLMTQIVMLFPLWYILTGLFWGSSALILYTNNSHKVKKIVYKLASGFFTTPKLGNRLKPRPVTRLQGVNPPFTNPVDYRTDENMDSEWSVNYPWYLKRIEGQQILDAGCMAHFGFTDSLLRYGYKVTGVDITKYKDQRKPDNFEFIPASVLHSGLSDNSFDTIIYNSLLEHLGLDHYKGTEKMNITAAQEQAMDEAHRMLKPGGVILLQVPYGQYPTVVTIKNNPFYEVVTGERLSWLLTSFKIEEMSFFSYEKAGWIEVSKSVADKVVVGGSYPPCLAFVKARKG